ncbi:MAG: carboxylating nicotinate-nucleotide diphosphorylase [Bdellovibrionales bacterium]
MPHPLIIEPIIRQALLEDLGHGNDITSENIIPPEVQTTAIMHAREKGVIAGIRVAESVFRMVDPDLQINRFVSSGESVLKGKEILSVQGCAQSVMAAERVALNMISHLSGIASATAQYVKAVKGTKAKICCTRKTLPGLRSLQKYAVLAGGGANHRFGLDDAILIKDNHIAIAGGIKAALDRAQTHSGHMMKIEIEVDTLEQLGEVLDHGGADVVMLDNMPPAMLKKAVAMIDGTLITEASGGVTLDTLKAIAESGVDYISVGALTHSVIALDIGLDIAIK